MQPAESSSCVARGWRAWGTGGVQRGTGDARPGHVHARTRMHSWHVCAGESDCTHASALEGLCGACSALTHPPQPLTPTRSSSPRPMELCPLPPPPRPGGRCRGRQPPLSTAPLLFPSCVLASLSAPSTPPAASGPCGGSHASPPRRVPRLPAPARRTCYTTCTASNAPSSASR